MLEGAALRSTLLQAALQARTLGRKNPQLNEVTGYFSGFRRGSCGRRKMSLAEAVGFTLKSLLSEKPLFMRASGYRRFHGLLLNQQKASSKILASVARLQRKGLIEPDLRFVIEFHSVLQEKVC